MPKRLAVFAIACLAMWHVFAQPPPFPEDFLRGSRTGRTLEGNTISFCVDPRDPAHPVDREIAEAIATVLLVEPVFHEIERIVQADEIDNIYLDLVNDCALTLGFKLIPGAYPEWVTPTRAYYTTGYVFVVDEPSWVRLGDIPRDLPVGGVPGTAGDVRLYTYLNTLPSDQRWPRHPRGTDRMALEAVLNGDLAAALVWGPSYWTLSAQEDAFDQLHWFAADGITEPIGVGGLALRGNDFLLDSVGQAIEYLAREGVIQEILDARGFPGRAP